MAVTMGDENDKNELDAEVSKLDKSLKTEPAMPADVKRLIETGMDQYFKLRNKELELQDKELAINEKKFFIRTAFLLLLIAALIILSIQNLLTKEVAIVLGISMGAMFNIDVLKKLI